MKRLSSVLFELICIGFSVFLLLQCLFAEIRLSQTEKEIENLTKQISAAEEEQGLLEVRLGSRMSLPQLDDYAVNVLGMQHPGQEQIRYIVLS